MKKLILICILANIASADMCTHYWDDLIEQNTKLDKVIKYRIKSEYRTTYQRLLYYAQKVVINCEEGGGKQIAALKVIEQVNKLYGVK